MRGHLGVALMLALGGTHSEPALPSIPAEDVVYTVGRARMVRDQIVARGITDRRVLAAMGRVPRQEFVPLARRSGSYEDGPLSIGHGQTISQPYIVAFMTAALDSRPTDRVLEIGTGSGYQAAVLSGLVAQVFSIEVVEPLAKRAEADLKRLGYDNVKIRAGDGYLGWPEQAPFDAVIVTCAPTKVPQALVDQLKVGGRMIIPVGPQWGVQELYMLRKHAGKMETRAVLPVRFVPMIKGNN